MGVLKHFASRHHRVAIITTAELHSTKPELRFFVGSNGLDLWRWSGLEIKLNTFRRSTIPQKQFIFIITSPKFIKTLRYFKSLCIIFMLNWFKYFQQKIKQFNQKCFNIFRPKYVPGGKLFQYSQVDITIQLSGDVFMGVLECQLRKSFLH